MKKIGFIWDLDGTLLDSYEAILAGIEETFAQLTFLMIRMRFVPLFYKLPFKICWKRWEKKEAWMLICSIRFVLRVWLRRMLKWF